MWKTDYFGHDEIYKNLKRSGGPGWGAYEDKASDADFLVGVFEKLGFVEQCKVLELGCGDGSISLLLAHRGYDSYGVDISPTAIEWAREKAGQLHPSPEFRVGNVLDLPYGDSAFDVVVDGSCLHCIIGEDRKSMLRQAFRVLRPGGLFIVMSLCGDPTEDSCREHFDPESRCFVVEGVARRYYGAPESILRELEAVGFGVKDWWIIHNHSGQTELRAITMRPE